MGGRDTIFAFSKDGTQGVDCAIECVGNGHFVAFVVAAGEPALENKREAKSVMQGGADGGLVLACVEA